MRKIAVENLRHVTKACFLEVTRKHFEPLTNLLLCLLAVDLQVRVDERAEQPCPDWPLMIRAVPGYRISHIPSSKPSVRCRQAAEAIGSKQLSFHSVYDCLRA